MKKFLSLFITMFMVVSFSTVVLALENKVINNVSVTGIDVPFSNSPTLDTTGVVKSGSGYRIYGISWKIPRETVSGFYEVTVTLKTNVGYIFSGDVSGTINGKSIAGYRIVDEDELDIVYAFDENSTTDDSSSNITPSISIIRHKITVYCNTEKGSITPIVVRVLEGKNQTFTITPKEGYKIKDVIVDGESVGAGGGG